MNEYGSWWQSGPNPPEYFSFKPGQGLNRLVGESPQAVMLRDRVSNAAVTDAPVLISGESGTGKESLARVIHETGARSKGPFVVVKCSSFTGRHFTRESVLSEIDGLGLVSWNMQTILDYCMGGTLFLDEVGFLSVQAQEELGALLDEGSFHRERNGVSGKKSVRVMASTSVDLGAMIARGAFRPDLLYRLNVISIQIPPLRERREEIPVLAERFLNHCAFKMNKPFDGITPDARDLLLRYPWPGNIRELFNAIERAVILGTPPALTAQDFAFLEPAEQIQKLDMSLADLERSYIERILKSQEGNISRAAKILGIHRSTLHKKVHLYGITCTRGRGRPRGSVKKRL